MILTMPAAPGLRSVVWRFQKPAQVNKSAFTSRRRVVILPKAPRRSADVQVVQINGEAAVRPWRSFLGQLDGQANQFRLVAVENDQDQVAQTVQVDGAGQTGNALATKGWFPQSGLLEGMFVTVEDQLLGLTSDAIAGDDGKAVLHLDSYLRVAPAADAAVETNLPWALVALTEDTTSITADVGQTYMVKFSVEESF